MKRIMNNCPKVAVIVPVYNVKRELIEHCVESIVAQTYQNIDIILVDDGNEEAYEAFLKELKEKDRRIAVIRHDQNRGLYQARLTGVSMSNSKYIAFVDADDTITIDWIRILVMNAEKNHSDIVMGRTICMDENNWKYVFNSNYSLCTRQMLEEKEIIDFFMKDCGLDFSIHTVWNKLYSRTLWERAWRDLREDSRHLVMTEDILFSCILFFYAQRMSFSNHDGYLYYRNSDSATLSGDSGDKYKKNIEDLIYVFQSVKCFMEKQGIFDEYKCFYEEWRDRYFRFWSPIFETNYRNDAEALKLRDKFLDAFEKKEYEYARAEDGYFEQKKTEWNCALEEIKRAVASQECIAVSFDLFDTLIMRPVLYPEDVYEIALSEIDIYPYDAKIITKYRRLAEEQVRRSINKRFPQYEDVTLGEIYEEMEERYNVDKALCERLKRKEIETELEFSVKRQTGEELYELACALGKEIFVISDMYLEMADIENVLHQNNYTGYSKVYLSSEERLLKSTGHLFDLFLSETGFEGINVVHIGDNWQSDVIIPADKGIKSFFLPKTKDILFNYLGDAYTGNGIGAAIGNSGSIVDYSRYFDSLAVRCLFAVAANTMFDNPFVSFNADSDYNGDPYFLGCVPVGMHMYGIAMWLLEQVRYADYEKVHFAARDGFYLKRIFDLINKSAAGTDAKSNYLYISRKALIPVEICEANFVDRILASCVFSANTPQTIIDRYNFVLKPLTEELAAEYKAAGFLLGKRFQNEDEFAVFIKVLKAQQFSEKKAKISFELCRKYLAGNIGKNDLIFDLGYSGRLHQYVVEAIGENVAGAYVNIAGYDALRRIEKKSLDIRSYYNFVPSMEGIINEYIFSDRNPSCVGYSENENGVIPLFEDKMKDYIGDYVVNEINRGACKFTEEFLKFFGKRRDIIKFQPMDASVLYENFLVMPKRFDENIFDCCMIEDEFFGGIKQKPLNEQWDWQRDDQKTNKVQTAQEQAVYAGQDLNYEVYLKNVHKRNLIVKGLYWFCVDKSFFKKRLSEHLKKGSGEENT
ncbi:MAG: glycosyltransferase [Firmicutes bacterium]|nr:glycosyltransferase [Bacillota bacterium]